jgi:hypothetical protein
MDYYRNVTVDRDETAHQTGVMDRGLDNLPDIVGLGDVPSAPATRTAVAAATSDGEAAAVAGEEE